MHAPLGDSASELDPASIHRIEGAIGRREPQAFAFAFNPIHPLSLSIHRTRIERSGLSDPGGRKSDMVVFVWLCGMGLAI